MAQTVERLLCWRLPKEGLARAESEFARLKERRERRESYVVHSEAPQASSATPSAAE